MLWQVSLRDTTSEKYLCPLNESTVPWCHREYPRGWSQPKWVALQLEDLFHPYQLKPLPIVRVDEEVETSIPQVYGHRPIARAHGIQEKGCHFHAERDTPEELVKYGEIKHLSTPTWSLGHRRNSPIETCGRMRGYLLLQPSWGMK